MALMALAGSELQLQTNKSASFAVTSRIKTVWDSLRDTVCPHVYLGNKGKFIDYIAKRFGKPFQIIEFSLAP